MAKVATDARPAAARPARKTPPGPRGNPILGMTLDLARDPLRFLLSVSRRYGEVVRYRFLFMHPSGPDLEAMTELIDAKKLEVVVDRVFPFAQAKEALAYLEAGRAKGKVVVSMSNPSDIE